jgi:hypothetical protein
LIGIHEFQAGNIPAQGLEPSFLPKTKPYDGDGGNFGDDVLNTSATTH